MSARPQIPSLQRDGTVFATDLEKAEVMNEYFCSVFMVDDQNTPFDNVGSESTLEVIDFDVLDVLEVLYNQDRKCSRGPDAIPHIMCRNLAAVLVLPLYFIFRDTLFTGTVPVL